MKTPCDEISMRSGTAGAPCTAKAGSWILAATILASSMAFIDGTIVNVAAPRFQSAFHATVVDVQWVIESYGLFLSSLILVGGALGDWLGRRAVFHAWRTDLLRHRRDTKERPIGPDLPHPVHLRRRQKLHQGWRLIREGLGLRGKR